MTYTIRYNQRTAHLQHTTTGSTCATVTRNTPTMGTYDPGATSLAEARDAFTDYADQHNLNTCRSCARVILTAIKTAYDIAQREAMSAAGQLEAAENFADEPRIALAEQRAETAYETYRDAAEAASRCLIFGCDTITAYRANCAEHSSIPYGGTDAALEAATTARHEADTAARMLAATEHDARTCQRRALGEPCEHCEPLFTALETARVAYRKAVDDADGYPNQITLAVADAALTAYQAAARDAAACLYYGCAAVVDNGGGWCTDHAPKQVRQIDAEALALAVENEPEAFAPVATAEPELVTACLDHTEPGKAIAIITGGHGREHAPQAWLAHKGGAWLLVDDYDGDTLNVKGPDADRAVHAWAALLGLKLDALTVSVEYAGGPVSPPVRATERPAVITLEWEQVSGTPRDVFEAHGRAHDYQITEHADAAGASLVAFLRGTAVDTHRRGYMTPADARAAAQHYEARYGSMYAPAE